MKRLGTKAQNTGRYKARSFKTFSDGYKLGNRLTEAWNSQPNPPKVSIGGHRIHHGLVGAGLTIAGILAEKPALAGFGASLAMDDIADMHDWLNFENNNSTQYYLPRNTPYYDGYA